MSVETEIGRMQSRSTGAKKLPKACKATNAGQTYFITLTRKVSNTDTGSV